MSKTKGSADIDRLRKKVDQIDSKVASLLKERAGLASQIILTKELAGATVTDPKRERTIVKRYLATLTRPIQAKRVRRLVRAILEITPQYQD